MTLVLAITMGLAFGFVLNRVGATNPDIIINMLRLKDLRLAKTILLAIGLSSILLFAGIGLGLIDAGHFSVKAASLGVIVGGALLGLGFAIAGYCPGTGLGAAATGRIDAIFFLLGGLVGAGAYMFAFDAVQATGILEKIMGGEVTLAVTGNEKYAALIDGVPGWLVAGAIGAALIVTAKLLPPRDCIGLCPFNKK